MHVTIYIPDQTDASLAALQTLARSSHAAANSSRDCRIRNALNRELQTRHRRLTIFELRRYQYCETITCINRQLVMK